MAGCQLREVLGAPVEEGTAADQDRTNALLRKTCRRSNRKVKRIVGSIRRSLSPGLGRRSKGGSDQLRDTVAN
jgi:hypothetical protein